MQQEGQRAALQGQLQDKQLGIEQQHYGDQAALAQAALQQRSAEIDQHAVVQDWARRREFTYQDQRQLQQMNQAVSEIETAHRDGRLDDDTYTAAMLKVKAHIDPIELKHQAALTKMRTAQVQQMTDTAKLNAALSNTDEAVRTQAINSRIIPRTNPATGQTEEFFLNHRGDMEAVPYGKGAGAADAAKQQQADLKLTTAAVTDYGKKLQQAVVNTQKYLEGKARQVKDGKAKPEDVPGWADALEQSKKELGVHVPAEQYVEGYRKLHGRSGQENANAAIGAAMGGAGGGQGGPPQGDKPVLPPDPRREVARQAAVKANPPMDAEKPETWTDQQRKDIADFREGGARVLFRPDLSPEQRQMYQQQYDAALASLYRYGSLGGMPEAEATHFTAILRSLDHATPKGAKGRHAPPPTPPQRAPFRPAADYAPPLSS